MEKFGKKVKGFVFFFSFFFKATIKKCFRGEVLSFWSISYSISPVSVQCTMKKSFGPAFKVSIDHLFVNLESGKKNYLLRKRSGKSLEFWIQKFVRTL